MLKQAWAAWKRFGHWMGDQVARVLLVVFYFTIALPFALIVRLTQDPMDVKQTSGAGWTPRVTKDVKLEDVGRSY